MTINLDHYQDFVEALTSSASNDLTVFKERLDRLDRNNELDSTNPTVNVSLLMTAALGLASETGEFCEIPKKIYFQGKPLTDEAVFHMKRELGDIIFYWVNACRALGLDPDGVIRENMSKLSARYPNGFSVERSEKRSAGDL